MTAQVGRDVEGREAVCGRVFGVRPGLQQEAHAGDVASLGRAAQGRDALPGREVDLGASCQQEGHYLYMLVLGRNVERARPAVVCGINLGAVGGRRPRVPCRQTRRGA